MKYTYQTKQLNRFLSLILTFALCHSAAFAADINLYGEEFSEKEIYVSDIAETNNILYLMTDSQTGESDLIIAAESGSPLRVRWRITTDDPDLAGYFFIGMEPREDGSLLALLWNYQKHLLVVFREGKPDSMLECPKRPELAEGMAVWIEEDSFVRWDGSETKTYPIPQSGGGISEFTLWNGSPCFVNQESRTVEKITENGTSETLYSMPTEGELMFYDLASCGELMLSYGVNSNGESGAASSFVCLSTGTAYSGGYRFLGARSQGDGTIALRLTDWADTGKMYYCYNGILSGDRLTVSEFVVFSDPIAEDSEGYDPSECAWEFTDSTGCRWRYFVSPPEDGCVVESILPDGTRTRYCIDEALAAANTLHELGLFNGVGTNADGTPNFDLDRTPTRQEAVTMLVRLLGKEEEAMAGNWTIPFTDVAEWAKPYVGYAYANGLANGTGEATFDGAATISATEYLTFVLRSLGYISGTDFQWDAAWDLSDKLGITNGQYGPETPFTRGDLAIVSRNSLSVSPKGESDDNTTKNESQSSPLSDLAFDALTGTEPAGVGLELVFESDDFIIFCNTYGVWGYDLSARQITFGIDVIKIFGEEIRIQGSYDPYTVRVQCSSDGKTVVISCADRDTSTDPETDRDAYFIDTSALTYQKGKYQPMEDAFKRENMAGYIRPGGTLGGSVYIRGDETWSLFAKES